MRKSATIGLILVVLMTTLAVSVYATCGKCPGKEGDLPCSKYFKAMKDANIEVKNIENGVVVTVTSDNPDMVKSIQEHWVKFKEALKSGNIKCLHEEGALKEKKAYKSGEKSAEWKKAKESGECTGHEGKEHKHLEKTEHEHKEGSEEAKKAPENE